MIASISPLQTGAAVDIFFLSSELTRRVNHLEEQSRDTRARVRDLEDQVKEVTRQADYLSAAVVALAEFLRDRHGISPEAINAKVHEVRLRGPVRHPRPRRCAACFRVSGPDCLSCKFCSAPFPADPLLPEPTAAPPSAAITSTPGQ